MTPPALSDLTRVFARIGLLSFGGPAAQIALMHRELVEARAWLSEDQFLRALSFCMLLPGPEAMQLATYAGWRLRGVPGGLIGGGLFVLPGALAVGLLAVLYVHFGHLPVAMALFVGVKATVVVIVLQALAKLSRRTLQAPDRWALAGLSFLGLYAFGLPFPVIVLGAGIYGFATARPSAGLAPEPMPHEHLGRTVALWAALWLLPIAALWAAGATFLTQIAVFFAKLAVVSFGGAYAVLAYMAQTVVADHGWITAPQMLDALGLAETTPGPLILVTQFVATLAGAAQGGTGLALAAGLAALWATFAPCFLWIFAGAPFIDHLAARPRLTGALSAITAAVVGVILNLSLWFAVHVYFAEVAVLRWGPVEAILPRPDSLLPVPVLLSAGAWVLLRRGWSLPVVLASAAILGAFAAQI